MARVLVNVMASGWSVHFIGPDGRSRIGPWLLCDSHDEVRGILKWGEASAEEMAEHERSIRGWGASSVVLDLPDAKVAALIARGKGWPWNGYELGLMKAAGKYPPKQRIPGPQATAGLDGAPAFTGQVSCVSES